METTTIVKAFNVVKDVTLGLKGRRIALVMAPFDFQGRKDTLRDVIVVAIAVRLMLTWMRCCLSSVW